MEPITNIDPTVPANDIDLSKFVPAVGEDLPQQPTSNKSTPRKSAMRKIIEEEEPEDEDDGVPVVLQQGPWEGAMANADIPMMLPSLALTTDQVAAASVPQPSRAQLEAQELRRLKEEQRHTESQKKAESGIFVGAVKGLLGLEEKKKQAERAMEAQQEEIDKARSDKYETCKRLITAFPTSVPKNAIRPDLSEATYDRFIKETCYNLDSGKLFENAKSSAVWGFKGVEVLGSMIGFRLKNDSDPSKSLSFMAKNAIEDGMFDEEIKEVAVFYPHFFRRPLWLRIAEKVFLLVIAVHEQNSSRSARLEAGPRKENRVNPQDMAQFAG
jgi:hypothetical protein